MRAIHRTGLLLACLLAALVLTACVTRTPLDGSPALPEGFGASLPDVPLSGYLYAAPPDSSVPLELDVQLPAGSGGVVPWQSPVQSISVWISPVDPQTGSTVITSRFVFLNEPDARAAYDAFAEARINGVDRVTHDGTRLDVVLGAGQYADMMEEALDEERLTTIQELGLVDWMESARSLPHAPGVPVVAAGYVHLPPQYVREVFEILAEQGGIDLRPLGDVLVNADADRTIIAVYGETLPALRIDLTADDLARRRIMLLAVAETAVPPPLLSWSFGLGARRAGLNRVELESGRVYRYDGHGLVALARTRGTDIHLSAALSVDDAAYILGQVPN